MEETKNSLALILNRQSYRERDSLVTVYTQKYGKLNLIARGTKKPGSKLAGHIEPLTLADIMIIRGKGLDYLGSAVMREAYLGIRSDLNRLYFAGRAVGLFKKAIKEEHSDSELFDLLRNWLSLIDKTTDIDKITGEFVLAGFILKLLSNLGYRPELRKCLACGREIKPGQNYFDFLRGGLIEESCLGDSLENINASGLKVVAISDDCIKLARFIDEHGLEALNKLRIKKKLAKELSSLLTDFTAFCI